MHQLYLDETLPYFKASGGKILFIGKGGAFLNGPPGEKWDLVMLIKQQSVESFMGFASHEGYLKNYRPQNSGPGRLPVIAD